MKDNNPTQINDFLPLIFTEAGKIASFPFNNIFLLLDIRHILFCFIALNLFFLFLFLFFCVLVWNMNPFIPKTENWICKNSHRPVTVCVAFDHFGTLLRTLSGTCSQTTDKTHLSRDMTKPTKSLCAQRRLRSAWASAQCFLMRTAKTRMPRLIWVFAGRTLSLWVLSYRASFHLAPTEPFDQNATVKPNKRPLGKKWVCAQQRLRSAWASAQSDQSLRRPHEESSGP